MKNRKRYLSLLFGVVFFLNFNFANAQLNTDPSTLIQTTTYSSEEELTDPYAPYNIFMSNISTSGFTLNWLTKDATTGSVIFEINNETLTKRTLDKRDVVGEDEKERYTHFVNITDASLKSTDKLYFKIFSNNIEYGNNSANFVFTPPTALNSPPSPFSQDGELTINFDSADNRDFIIATKIDDNSLWASTVPSSNTGTVTWNIPLGGILTTSFESYAFQSGSTMNISVFGEKQTSTKLDVLSSDDVISISIEENPLFNIPTPITTPIITVQPTINAPTPTITNSPAEIPVVLDSLPQTGISDFVSANTLSIFVLFAGILVLIIDRLIKFANHY